MPSPTFTPITGLIRDMSPLPDDCCSQMVSLISSDGPSSLILSPESYVVNHLMLRPGMRITAFYDADQPVPLIFPPRYHAEIVTTKGANEQVTVQYFDDQLVSADQSLSLNIARSTRVLTSNGQMFPCSPGGHMLIVYYQTTTRSIPAQTTPTRIIVLC